MRIIFYGAYGVGNIGDEATLDVLLDKFQKYFPNSQTLAFSANPTKTEFIHAVQSSKPDLLALLKTNILVIDDLDTIYKFVFAFLGRILKKRVIFYGVGAPKLNTAMKILIPFALDVDDFSVRDLYSKNTFAHYGLKRAIRVIPDPAIQLKPIDKSEAKQILVNNNVDTNRFLVGLCLRHCSTEEKTEQLKQLFVETVDWLITEMKAQVIFMPMCMHSSAELDKDQLFGEELKRAIKMPQNFAVLSNVQSPKAVKGVFSLMDICIGMRLHSAVFAYSTGIPFIGIVTGWKDYDEKIISFMHTFQGKAPLKLNNLDAASLKNEIIRTARAK